VLGKTPRGPHRAGPRCPRSGENGQTLVEFALAAPVFFAMLFGIVELGLLFKTRSAYQEGAQNAARAIAAASASDTDGLSQLRTILAGENLNNIQSVDIYDSTVGGATLSATSPSTPTITTYRYTPTLGFTCGTGSPPPCPASWTVRNRTLGSLDYVGVRITYRYRGVTGVIPPLTLIQIATAELEPSQYGS